MNSVLGGVVERVAGARRRARAWAHVAEAAVMRRAQPGWDGPPRAAHLIVTYRCNLRCRHCDSWKVREHADLTLDDWRAVLPQLRSLDVVKVLGGEPFARRDMPELLEAVRQHVDPHLLQLTSNGTVQAPLLDALDRVGWPGLQLRISVDGPEAVHELQRGVVGSFARVEDTLRRIGPIRARRGFSLGINFALTDESIGAVDALRAFAQRYDAELVLGVNVAPFLVGTRPPEVERPRVVGITDLAAARAALTDPRLRAARQLPLLDHLVERLAGRGAAAALDGPQAFPCRELRQLLYVLPNGDLVRCGLDSRPAGNLATDGLAAIWASPARAALLHDVDHCPGCLQASVHILSRLYGGCLWS
ncbi:MAG: Cyclic pyranopterin monophosphate synthase [Pseudomonadota bacterium]